MLAFSLALPRVAPLAARPAPTLSTSSFVVKQVCTHLPQGKAFCSRKTAPPSTLVGSRCSSKQKSTTRVLFVLEQATRVELARSSLGSCRHTARRRLLISFVMLLYPFLHGLSMFLLPLCKFREKNFPRKALLRHNHPNFSPQHIKSRAITLGFSQSFIP